MERSPPSNAHRGRLFRKYLTLILSLVTTVLLVSSGVNLYSSYQENKAALASLQHEKAIAAASRIEQYVRQISQQLTYAALPQLDAGDVEMRRVEFLKLLRQAPEITDIALLDADGRERNAVSRLGMDVTGSGRDRSAEPAFVNAKRGQPWYGPVYFRKETEPYMTVAIRSGGDKGPVTVAEVNLKFIWDVVSRIKIGEKGKAYVVDATGQLVADPDIGLVLRKTSLAELAHVKAASAAANDDEPAMVSKDLNGTSVLASAAPIAALDWRVFVEQPVAEVYTKLNASILRTGLLLLAGLAVSALAALALARSMVRPIRTLDEGARRIGAGELDQQIVVRTGDELEGLADQFNRMTSQLRESYAGLERKVEQRTAEVTESLEYQTAISEVLRVISGSTTDLAPVFAAIMDSARRLFAAPIAAAFRHDGRMVHLTATSGWSDESLADARRLYPGPPNLAMLSGRVILSGQVQTIVDTHADPAYDATTAHVGQWRRMIGAPMLKDGTPVGVIVVAWPDPGETPRRQADLLQTFADQAVIAIENVRLIDETREALERQTATAEILRVISSSVTDTQPVFDAIVQSCRRLFGGKAVHLAMPKGDMIESVAYAADVPDRTGVGFLKPWPLDRGSGAGTCILESRVIVVADTVEGAKIFPRMHDLAIALGYRSCLFVPLLREGGALGSITILRETTGEFDSQEVSLAQTFADQAVIAIENVRLFNETREALEKQTAIADILRVISSSPTDTQPVFEAIVTSCQHLFRGRAVGFALPRGAMIEVVAFADDGTRGDRSGGFLEPWPLDRDSAAGACLLDARVVNIGATDEGVKTYPRMKGLMIALGYHSGLFVPLLRDGRGLGAICILRATAGEFNEQEVALASTFADQAVIAIENVRLFNETKEALEQQTATAEVLQVISGSPTDVQPVLEAVAERSRLLCRAHASRVWLVDGDHLRSMTGYLSEDGSTSGRDEVLPLKDTSVAGRAFVDRRTVHVEDVAALIDSDFPDARRIQARHGFRTVLGVPMLRDGVSIGTIGVLRKQVQAFSAAEIRLVETFASQAVIAIENVRLFNETREALEQQTASAEVLQVISSSVADPQPVFEKILDSCHRLFDCTDTAITVIGDDGRLHLSAARGTVGNDLAQVFPIPFEGSATHLAIMERRVLSYRNVLTDPDVPTILRAVAERVGGGPLSQALAPMLWEGRGVGALSITRRPATGFSDKEIALLKTFADQAGIAIENARLFNETKEALERQTATAEILQVISNSVSDTQPVFDKIMDSCERLFDGSEMGILLVGGDGQQLHLAAHHGSALEALKGFYPRPLDGTVPGLAITGQRLLNYSDVLGTPDAPKVLREIADKVGNYSIIVAPMIWKDQAIGTIHVTHSPPQPFSDKEMNLLKTFADQAVIAIQNARLFHEIQAKTRELEAANQHKSEFLANMSHELRTPLNAIIGFSEVLIERMFGELNDKQDDYLKDIHSSGKHLLSLINDILDLAKIEAGRMELDLGSFDAAGAIGNAMTLVRERAQRHGVSLGLETGDAVGEIRADERKFKQILLNLLTNAVKFTPDGGKIVVRARMLGGGIEVAVTDTGIGISKEDQVVVFDEFRQVGRHYTNKQEGTGLGLALTKRFVELHGGTLRLTSEPGVGSTFTFTLPHQA